jgi:hypothetical protein
MRLQAWIANGLDVRRARASAADEPFAAGL